MKLRSAFGAIEIIFVIIIILVVYYTCFNNPYGRSNPFVESGKQIKTEQKAVDDKIEEIQNTKTLMNEQIKKNLEGNY